jgi:hypothetical protein
MQGENKSNQFRVIERNGRHLPSKMIELADGKKLDYSLIPRNERRTLEKKIRTNENLKFKIKYLMSVDFCDSPITAKYYFCQKCNRKHLTFRIDKGLDPITMICKSCNFQSLVAGDVTVIDQIIPDFIFRKPTFEEYISSKIENQNSMDAGHLYCEKTREYAIK